MRKNILWSITSDLPLFLLYSGKTLFFTLKQEKRENFSLLHGKENLQSLFPAVYYRQLNRKGDFMKKIFRYFCLLSSVILLTGCHSNKYEEHYTSVTDQNHYIPTEKPARLVELTDASQITKLQTSDDYILIGTSTFYGLWTPRTFAIDCAEKYGASLVLVSYRVGETKNETLTKYVQTRQKTHHYGTAYGYYGYQTYYLGSTKTYGTMPVTINYQNTYYHQYAYFFGERRNKNAFGIYFQLPENIPGNKNKKIRVSAVAANSPAAKQGIKAGDIVKAINGREIRNAEEIAPFMNGTEKIVKVEVTHE